jgi:hypothetical protein
MKRTPESVSKARQKLKNEIDTWKARIREAENSLQLDPAARAAVALRVSYGKARLVECKQQMAALKNKGMRKFWQKVRTHEE